MNVVFLDFDGVVNTPMWTLTYLGNFKSVFNYPEDGFVNNYQATQWVSEFCEKYNYKIVISSSWRLDNSLQECTEFLIKGGLRKSVEVIDMTPDFRDQDRGEEISMWLKLHPEVTGYLIFDDDNDMTVHMDRLVLCDIGAGFLRTQFNEAVTLHQAFNNNKK